MTIEEFYKWAKENNITDYTMKVQYRDDGGDYYGEDNVIMDLSGLDDVKGGHSGGPIFDNDGIIWSNYTFGGGAYSGGGRAVDSWLYDILQDEYYKSIKRYSRYSNLYS